MEKNIDKFDDSFSDEDISEERVIIKSDTKEELIEKYGIKTSRERFEVFDINTDIDDLPNKHAWKFPDLNNQTTRWSVGFEPKTAKLITWSMHLSSDHWLWYPKDIESKAGRTNKEQAYQEACQLMKVKITSDNYVIPGNPVIIKDPMSAYKYPERKITVWPVLAGFKYDGHRCLARLEDEKVILRTRSNNPYYFLEHIQKAVEFVLKFLPAGSELDGELFRNGLTYQQISSLVTCKVNKPKKVKKIQLHCFDVVLQNDKGYLKRYNNIIIPAFKSALEAGMPPNIIILSNNEICYNKKDIEIEMKKALKLGYEGLMIRKTNAIYTHSRSASILKYKLFDDYDGTIIACNEGKGKFTGQAILTLNYKHKYKGKIFEMIFDITAGGTEQEKRWVFDNKRNIINKLYTFKCQGFSDGMLNPRFPIGLRFKEDN